MSTLFVCVECKAVNFDENLRTISHKVLVHILGRANVDLANIPNLHDRYVQHSCKFTRQELRLVPALVSMWLDGKPGDAYFCLSLMSLSGPVDLLQSVILTLKN